MYTLWLRSTNFQKHLKPFQKQMCLNCDIKEVHNLNCTHFLSVPVHNIWKYLNSGHHIAIQTVMMETNKHDILSESKYVVWYQKNVQFKASLGNIYTPKACRQVKMKFIPVPRKAKFTRLRDILILVYCPSRIKYAIIGDQEYNGWNIGANPLHL